MCRNYWKILFTLCAMQACLSQQEFCPCDKFNLIEEGCQQIDGRYNCIPSTEIIGGEVAAVEEWPYIVSFQLKVASKGAGCYSHFCGGSLIAPNIVLSAAHCFQDPIILTGYRGVPLSSIYVSKAPYCRHLPSSDGGYRIEVEYIELHPTWNSNWRVDGISGDIAVVVLSQNLAGPYVQLEQQYFQPPVALPITIAGYGNVTPKEQSFTTLYNMRQLYKAELSYYSEFLCKFLLTKFDESQGNNFQSAQFLDYEQMICAYRSTMDSCRGDSGGPAVRKGISAEEDILIGVMSWGPPAQCTSSIKGQAPAVLTRVSTFYPWIMQQIQQYQNFQAIAATATTQDPFNNTNNVVFKVIIPGSP